MNSLGDNDSWGGPDTTELSRGDFGCMTNDEPYQAHLMRFQRCPACTRAAHVTIVDDNVPMVSCTKPGCMMWSDPAPALRDKVKELEEMLKTQITYTAKLEGRCVECGFPINEGYNHYHTCSQNT